MVRLFRGRREAAISLPVSVESGSLYGEGQGNSEKQHAEDLTCPSLPSAAKQVMDQAFADLKTLLGNLQSCPQCDTQIFKPLNMKRSDFLKYLQQTSKICDGTRATPMASLVDPNPLYNGKTIAYYFQSQNGENKPEAATVRSGPSSPC